MAEGSGVFKQSLEDMEREITCVICVEHYKDPKVLPCCHYYCKKCIHKLAMRTMTGEPFSCPECRKPMTLPQGGVDLLPTAFFINRLKELFSSMERISEQVEARCEMCPGSKAEAFCRQCSMFICAQCVEPHQRMRVFAGHETITLAKLKESGTAMLQPVLPPCPQHKEVMKIYCFDCKVCICRDCIVKDHSGHNFEFISVAVPSAKSDIMQNLLSLKDVEKKLSLIASNIKTTKHEVRAQEHSLVNEVNSLFEELHRIIDERKSELLAETALHSSRKLENLLIQEESITMSCAVTQSVIDFAEQCVKYSADHEFMVMHAEIQSRISEAVSDHQKKLDNPDAIPKTDVGTLLDCASSLKQFCQAEARVCELVVEYSVSGAGLKYAEVGKQCEVVVAVVLSNGKIPKRSHVVKSSLKSLISGVLTQCNVNSIGNGQFSVQYTPSVRGRHELVVVANGQEVRGSPFPVFVTIDPTKLVKPVRVITSFDDCNDVSVNSSGEVFVATSAGIFVFDEEGKSLKNSGDLGLGAKFYNVEIDDDGFVYGIVATKASTDLVKLNKDLILVKRCKIHDCVKRYLSGLAVVKDEVMVCDYTSDCIKTFSKDELCLQRNIGSVAAQFKYIRGLSFDRYTKLYVSEEGQRCVKVLNTDGKFLYSFGCDNRLRCPVGVCVAGQYVYVTDHYYRDCVSVFTTEGEYIASFGQRGTEEGDFNCVWGVCIDSNGFLYVCDCANRRVQIF